MSVDVDKDVSITVIRAGDEIVGICKKHGEQRFISPNQNGDSFCSVCFAELEHSFREAGNRISKTLVEGNIKDFSMGCSVEPQVSQVIFCSICGKDILIDQEHLFNLEHNFHICCLCEPQLRKEVRVLKLSIEPGGNWMGFRLDDNGSCDDFLEEVLEIAREMSSGDSLIVKVEDVSMLEVLKWKDFQGW
jgi:hypothetical protein